MIFFSDDKFTSIRVDYLMIGDIVVKPIDNMMGILEGKVLSKLEKDDGSYDVSLEVEGSTKVESFQKNARLLMRRRSKKLFGIF